MPEASISLDFSEVDRLVAAIKDYGEGADDIISDVLYDDGAIYIGEEARDRIHPSGRTWKGKKASATRTWPFVSKHGRLSVTVSTKSTYGYLYFPDDGTNSRWHQGQQHFMKRGAEAAKPKIIDRCIAELKDNL